MWRARARTSVTVTMLVSERSVRLGGEMVEVGDDPTHRPFWDLVDAGRWEPATWKPFPA
jgi:hypothetical protein